MARPQSEEPVVTFKLWKKTLKKLRLLSSLTDENMNALAEDMANERLQKVIAQQSEGGKLSAMETLLRAIEEKEAT